MTFCIPSPGYRRRGPRKLTLTLSPDEWVELHAKAATEDRDPKMLMLWALAAFKPRRPPPRVYVISGDGRPTEPLCRRCWPGEYPVQSQGNELASCVVCGLFKTHWRASAKRVAKSRETA